MAPSPNQSPTSSRTRNCSLLRREGSASFHGRTLAAEQQQQQLLRRPKTQPDLLVGTTTKTGPSSAAAENKKKVPAKVLVNVTVQRSLGPLHVMASTEWKVEDLVVTAVKQYRKENRRPLLTSQDDDDASGFSLHYSQFSLQSLDPKEKLIGLGSRNFFLCPSQTTQSQTTYCSREVGKDSRITIPWLRFMNFLF